MQTVKNWAEFLKHFDFKSAIGVPVELKYEKSDRGNDSIYVGITVLDNRGSGRAIPIGMWHRVEPLESWLPNHRVEFALMTIRRIIQDVFLHEIDESILYESQRVFDPHLPGSKPIMEMLVD